MIQISSLSKSFSDRVLFDEVSFAINPGERIGLVGRNGDGKTTLFKVLIGTEEPDSGNIRFPSGYRVGHLSQHLVFNEETTLAEAMTGLIGDAKWSEGYKVESYLQGLGFTAEQLAEDPSKLSGGYQIRLNLAKLMASEPNLLLLDEPTNYLDILSLRWLARFLAEWKGELIMITHDHGFMNSISTHTLGIHRKRIRKIAGPTEKYYKQIAVEEEVHEQSRLNQEKKIKDTQKFIDSFRAKASKAKAVQSRVKELERMDKIDKLEEIKNLDFKFSYTPFPSKRLMQLENISFAYPNSETLIDDFNLTISAKDRIGVLGKNGKGKSTLLRLMVGELKPVTGETNKSPNLKHAYFGQTNVDRLNLTNTIEGELLSLDNVDNRTHARSIAGLMMFQGDDALKEISCLSGGEKARVMLAKNLLTPANILFLDEPTNHLDMYSTDALLDAVKSFDGAVVMVTHSEMFLKEVANRLIIFDRDKVTLFEGGYQDFIQRVGWQDEEELGEQVKTKKKNSSNKQIRELRKQIAKMEKKIEKTEEQVQVKTRELIEITKDGYGKQAENLSDEIKKIKSDVDYLYSELEDLTTQLELLEE